MGKHLFSESKQPPGKSQPTVCATVEGNEPPGHLHWFKKGFFWLPQKEPNASEVLEQLGFQNFGNETTYFNVVIGEAIDIMMISPDIPVFVGDWRVSNDITLSDHRCIDFVTGIDPFPATPFRNPRKIDWATYKIGLSALVGILGKRIKFNARIGKTTQMITTQDAKKE